MSDDALKILARIRTVSEMAEAFGDNFAAHDTVLHSGKQRG